MAKVTVNIIPYRAILDFPIAFEELDTPIVHSRILSIDLSIPKANIEGRMTVDQLIVFPEIAWQETIELEC